MTKLKRRTLGGSGANNRGYHAMKFHTTILIACISCLIAARSTIGETPLPVSYNRDIRPILSDNCFHCHGPDSGSREADLRLDTREGATAHVVVPGKPDESEIIARVFSDNPDEMMPPPATKRQLTAEQKALLHRWIASGAEYQPHWSFTAPQRVDVPTSRQPTWVRNPIDHFVLAKLKEHGLTPSPEADRPSLIRRLTFDLTGLPPTLAETDAFVADISPDAYEQLVERLLASPRYGEHMARYWMDVVRYGDTHGLHYDNQRSLWKYRDWVIDAFNQNLPFDQFTIAQMAGDLLPNASLDQKIASGYNRCNVSTNEAGSIDEEVLVRYAADRTEAMATVWLGLTVGCASCHDHKFDPISQKEFYQLFTFFRGAADAAMDGNNLTPPPLIKLPTPEQESEQEQLAGQIAAVQQTIATELAKIDYQETDGAPNCDKVDTSDTITMPLDVENWESQLEWETHELSLETSSVPAAVLTAMKVERDKRTDEQKKTIREHFLQNAYVKTRGIFTSLQQHLAELNKRNSELDAQIVTTMVMAELPAPRETFVLIRGEYDKPGDKVAAAIPAALPPLPAGAPANRLGLAQWLVDPANPLPARVTVNRFWQQYFGAGIVKTAQDFGVQGQLPTHPELLDWLATEFIRTGWDVKQMQRLIVTSATYRQASTISPAQLERDASNDWLARGPRFRLDAEMIRDSALAAAGLLVNRVGGQSVKPYQPEGIWNAVAFVGSNTADYTVDKGESLYRRSLYLFWKRTAPPPILTTFDAPSRETCTVRRPRTNTPLQALLLMNDVQYVEASRKLAERILTEGGSTPEERAVFGFRLTTTRQPRPAEVTALMNVFRAQLAEYQADKEAALKLIAVGDSKRNEALDASELAAWTMMANLFLNLDETVTKE